MATSETRAGTVDEHDEDVKDLLAARSGDPDGGRALVRRHGAAMMRTAWRVLGRYGPREGEDVVQDALIAALTTSALPVGDVGAWLRAITARKALDSLRQHQRRREDPLAADAGTAGKASPLDGASANAPTVEVLALREAMSRLSASDRAVLTLVDLEGFSMAEAAEALGLSRVAVKLRAMRARRKLAARLQSPENVHHE